MLSLTLNIYKHEKDYLKCISDMACFNVVEEANIEVVFVDYDREEIEGSWMVITTETCLHRSEDGVKNYYKGCIEIAKDFKFVSSYTIEEFIKLMREAVLQRAEELKS